jgi:hypothetical protein
MPRAIEPERLDLKKHPALSAVLRANSHAAYGQFDLIRIGGL